MDRVLVVLHALHFAAKAHRTQKRKDEETPYINHLIDVVTILTECDVTDPTILAAAALHDVIEDQQVPRTQIAEMFGEEVAALVVEVTDDKELPKAERKSLQIEHAPHLSDAAKLLKIADKISNVVDVAFSPALGWEASRRHEYLDWADDVFQGLRGVNDALDARFEAALAASRAHIASDASPGRP